MNVTRGVLTAHLKLVLDGPKNCFPHFIHSSFLKVSPTIFTQVFTILGHVPAVIGDPNSRTVALPLVYALLSSKSEEAYRAVYEAVLSEAEEIGIENFEPQTIMTDFELAILNAGKATFSEEMEYSCCFFHLKQSVYRKVQAQGLVRAYNGEDSAVRDFCHMMAGLAFVPVCDVKAGFLALKANAPDVDGIPELVTYFSENYVLGKPGAGARRRVPPRFEPVLWNCYQATLQGLGSTNNSSEGWHNRFAQMLNKNHPDIYTLLNALKKEQGDTELSILELRLGRTVKAAPKKKWVEAQNRMKITVQNYDAYGVPRILEYLKLVSYHVTFD